MQKLKQTHKEKNTQRQNKTPILSSATILHQND